MYNLKYNYKAARNQNSNDGHFSGLFGGHSSGQFGGHSSGQ